MRGKAYNAIKNVFNGRITPAYAGKSKIVQHFGVTTEDHPRLCGEKLRKRFIQRTAKGSPPPMRGKGRVRGKSTRPSRITPAYAGKSSTEDRLIVFYKDHPRLCGEKSGAFLNITAVYGSPPPMRGKGCIRKFMEENIRITPAYAGKSYIQQFPRKFFWDHPRLCGEKQAMNTENENPTGSPPPMRGKALLQHILPRMIRITPAYAGKRSIPDCWCQCRQDHPRLCGEKTGDYTKEQYEAGSPPPMRGKVIDVQCDLHGQRITPAYAGKSVR